MLTTRHTYVRSILRIASLRQSCFSSHYMMESTRRYDASQMVPAPLYCCRVTEHPTHDIDTYSPSHDTFALDRQWLFRGADWGPALSEIDPLFLQNFFSYCYYHHTPVALPCHCSDQ